MHNKRRQISTLIRHKMIDHVVQNERLQYTCPIHPEVVMDRPGICPECGMQLVPKEPEIRIAGEPMTILKRQK